MGEKESSEPVQHTPQRSLGTAYLLLLLLGYFGVHRFYVGRWFTALVITGLSFALAFLELFDEFAWLWLAIIVVDGLFLPRFIRIRNEQFATDFALHPERYLIADDESIAPWARGRDKRSPSGAVVIVIRNYFFFWVVPTMTGIAAAQYHSLELLIIPIAILAAIGLIGSLDKTLMRYPTILEIPGVGPALERVAAMRKHYWESEPQIRTAFSGLFRHATTRYKPYWSLAGIVVATVIIEGVISYEDNTSYIPLQDAAWIVGITAIIAGAIALLNLVPLTALSFHYALSGKTTRLGFMTVGALLATIAGYSIGTLQESRDGGGALPSELSMKRLEKRMENPEFRGALVEKMDVFLEYYIDFEEDPEKLKENFSALIAGIAPNDEPEAFGVYNSENIAGVIYHHPGATCTLEGFIDFSLLAVVHKPSQEERMTELTNLSSDGTWDPLDIIEYMSLKRVAYSWAHVPDALHEEIPEGCRTLICDLEGSCSWPEDTPPAEPE